MIMINYIYKFLIHLITLIIPGLFFLSIALVQGVVNTDNWFLYIILPTPLWIMFSIPISSYINDELF